MLVQERILALMQAKGVLKTQIAQSLGVSNAFITRLLNGQAKINLEHLFKICDYLDVSLSDFFQPFQMEKKLPDSVSALLADCKRLNASDAESVHYIVKSLLRKNEEIARAVASQETAVVTSTVQEDDTDEDDEDEEPKFYLPLLGGAAAGSPIYHPADDGDTVVVPERYADPDRYAVFQARGDSMEPRIPDGAFIVTEVNALPADGEVAVVMLSSFSDAEYVVKRVYRKRNSAILRSYNPKYTDMEVAADEVRSAYRMVEIIR